MTEIQQQNTSELELIEVDIQLLCRFCGSFNENDQIISIFDHVGLENELPKRIEEYLPIKIYESDILPTKICIQCTKTIITWHKFILSCDETNKRFQNMIENMSNDVYHDEAENVAETFDETVEYLQDDEAEEITSKSEITGDFNGDNISTEQNFTIEDQHSMVKEEAVETEDEDEKDGVENKKPNSEIIEECNSQTISSNNNQTDDRCGIFKNKRLFKVDIFQQHLLKCTQCKRSFKTREETEKHIATHKKIDNKFLCEYCGTLLDSLTLLEKHLLKHNIDIILRCCTDCNLIFNDNNKYKMHIKSNHSKTDNTNSIINYECTICNEVFMLKSELKSHSDALHNDFKCNLCDKKFKKEIYLKIHKEIHSDVPLYNCPICNKSFTRKYNMEKHIPVHEKDNYCKICCLSFVSTLSLEQHIADEHDKLEILNYENYNKKIECNDCDEVFLSKFTLFNHRNEKHLGIKVIKCDECNRQFKTIQILETHKKNHKKDLECKICQKKFIKQRSLNEHIMMHTGEKPHSCDVCNERFRFLSNLNQHKLHHTKIRKYKCMYCTQKFKRSNTYREHLRIHLKEKNFRCDLCDVAFTQKSVLTKHRKKMHRTCEICDEHIGDKMKMLVHVWKEHPKEDQIALLQN